MTVSRRKRDPGTMTAIVALVLLYGTWHIGLGHREPALAFEAPKYNTLDGLPAGFSLPESSYTMSEAAKAGQKVYENYCIGCHGPKGMGQGPAATVLIPKPRNFMTGKFKFVSSLQGTLPRHEDLLKTVTYGLPGSSMPSFKLLSESDRNNVVEFVLHLTRQARYWNKLKGLTKLTLEEVKEEASDLDDEEKEEDYKGLSDDEILSQMFKESFEENVLEDIESNNPVQEAVQMFPQKPEPALSFETLAVGYQKYLGYCISCHGELGRGRPMTGDAAVDGYGDQSRPRNLLKPETYRHGDSSSDLWYRIMRGLEGTHMPAGTTFSAEEGWGVAHYVKWLGTPELQQQYPFESIKSAAKNK